MYAHISMYMLVRAESAHESVCMVMSTCSWGHKQAEVLEIKNDGVI